KPLRSAPCVSRAASRALVSREAPAASPSRASGCVSVTLRMFHEDVGGIFQATEKRTRNAALTRAGDDRSWSEDLRSQAAAEHPPDRPRLEQQLAVGSIAFTQDRDPHRGLEEHTDGAERELGLWPELRCRAPLGALGGAAIGEQGAPDRAAVQRRADMKRNAQRVGEPPSNSQRDAGPQLRVGAPKARVGELSRAADLDASAE